MAQKCTGALKLTLPTLIDGMDGAAEKGYAGWPDRIYVLGLDGKVAYRGEPGPRGFSVDEAAAAVAKLLGKGAGGTGGPK